MTEIRFTRPMRYPLHLIRRFVNIRRISCLVGLLLVSLTSPLLAQVGIGTAAPDPSAQLDIVSTNKGILVPRVSTTTAVPAPAEGLLVYQTGSPQGYYLNTQGSWQKLMTQSEQSAAIAAATAPSYAFATRMAPVSVASFDYLSFPTYQQVSSDVLVTNANRVILTKPGVYHVTYAVTVNSPNAMFIALIDNASPYNSVVRGGSSTPAELRTDFIMDVTKPNSIFLIYNSASSPIQVNAASLTITRL